MLTSLHSPLFLLHPHGVDGVEPMFCFVLGFVLFFSGGFGGDHAGSSLHFCTQGLNKQIRVLALGWNTLNTVHTYYYRLN